MGVKYGMGPIARPDAQLFLLGSLPGDASLAARRYYAHPTNQFWRLLGGALGEDLQTLDYEQRLARLAERRVGLWDVVAAATREGSLDRAIRDAAHNPLASLHRDFRHLRAIGFNGGMAARVGRKLIGAPPGITLVDLPSSSAANTRPIAEKAAAWSRLAQFVPPAQNGGR